MPYSWASGLSTDQSQPKAPNVTQDTIALIWPAALGTVIGFVVLRILGIGGQESLLVASISAGVTTLCTELVKARMMPPLQSQTPASGG